MGSDESQKETVIDPELARMLRSASDSEAKEGDLEADRVDAIYQGVLGQVSEAETSPVGRIRSSPTWARRTIAISTFTILACVMGAVFLRTDWQYYPLWRMAAELGAMGVLLITSLVFATRPLHRPAIPGWKAMGLALLVVASTLILAALPAAHGHAGSFPAPGTGLLQHAAPCMVLGLLVGLPVFAIARIADRGALFGPLLAASAAGLAGDFVLQLKCHVTSTDHMVAGHFTVVLLYVGGILLLTKLSRSAKTR